ncbi:VOC family protein [Geodermatophilus sp. SYSU D00700]
MSTAIYGMPMFATLVTPDVDRLVSWYVEGLGFIELFTIPGPDGSAALVHLRRWQFQDLLVRPGPGAERPSPEPTASEHQTTAVAFAAVHTELDGLVERARRHGGGRVTDPFDTAWNTRDVLATDPDGRVVAFTAARPPGDKDRTFAASMRRWRSDQP